MPWCIRFLSAALLLFTRLGNALRQDQAELTDVKFKELATVEAESTFTKGDADADMKLSSQKTGSGFCKDFWHDLGFADGFSNDVASPQAGLMQVDEAVQSAIKPRGLAALGLLASNAALSLAFAPPPFRSNGTFRPELPHELVASMPQSGDFISWDQRFEAARAKMDAVSQAKQRRNNAELEAKRPRRGRREGLLTAKQEKLAAAKEGFAWVGIEYLEQAKAAQEDFTRITCIPERNTWDYDLPELVRVGSETWEEKQLYHATTFKLKGPDGEPQETPDGPAFFSDNPVFSSVVGKAALEPASNSQSQKEWLEQRHRPGREVAHDSPRYDLHKYAVNDLVLLKSRSAFQLLSWLIDVIDSKALESVATFIIKNTPEYQELKPCLGDMLERLGGDLSVLRNGRTTRLNFSFDVRLTQLFANTISELRTIDDVILDQILLRSGTGDSRPGRNEMYVSARELKEVDGYINMEWNSARRQAGGDEYILLNPKAHLKRVSKEGVDV